METRSGCWRSNAVFHHEFHLDLFYEPVANKNVKALVFKRYGKSDQITFADIPRPALQPDEILVQVHASGLTRLIT